MKNTVKKIISSALALMLTAFVLVALPLAIMVSSLATPDFASAQQGPDYGAKPPPAAPSGGGEFTLFPGQTGGEVICRGSRDWGTFISAIISYDDFVEYWKDILVRYSSNICHYQDIDGLLRRINKVREQIRKAFYVCADTTKMKRTYYELEAELYYLRKYIKTDYSEFKVVGDDQVRSDLRGYFVLNKGFFTDDEITKLFEKFKSKYKPRLDTYKNCKDVTWQNLVDKWNEFKNNAGGFGPAIKQASASISKRWERMAKTSMNLGRNFFGGFLDARINGLSAKEGLDQITAELKKNLPSGFTFSELQAAQSVSAQKYDYAVMEESYMAQYQAQYKETSDQYTKEIMDRLNLLNVVITQTYTFENQTIQCVKGINQKQC